MILIICQMFLFFTMNVMWGQAYTRRRRARDMRQATERVAREQSEPATGG
jgi:hypothetical protein